MENISGKTILNNEGTPHISVISESWSEKKFIQNAKEFNLNIISARPFEFTGSTTRGIEINFTETNLKEDPENIRRFMRSEKLKECDFFLFRDVRLDLDNKKIVYIHNNYPGLLPKYHKDGVEYPSLYHPENEEENITRDAETWMLPDDVFIPQLAILVEGKIEDFFKRGIIDRNIKKGVEHALSKVKLGENLKECDEKDRRFFTFLLSRIKFFRNYQDCKEIFDCLMKNTDHSTMKINWEENMLASWKDNLFIHSGVSKTSEPKMLQVNHKSQTFLLFCPV